MDTITKIPYAPNKTMSNQQPRFRYDGFSSPNGTVVPDEFFDLLAPNLSEAELRVLLYVIRRTFGFKKEKDNISLKQLVDGIRTRDGRILDRGAGIAKSAAARAVKGLVQKGIIIATRNSSPEKGDEPTTYQIRFRSGHNPHDLPVSSKGTRALPPQEHPRVLHEDTQETVLQQTDFNLSNTRKAKPQNEKLNEPETHATAKTSYLMLTRSNNNQQPSGGLEAIGEVLRRKEHVSQGTDEDNQIIRAYIEGFAREFADRASLQSSASRAIHLYTRSRSSLQAFIKQMYQARSITKERSGRVANSSHQAVTAKRKMAYFFACLEDQLGLRRSNAHNNLAQESS